MDYEAVMAVPEETKVLVAASLSEVFKREELQAASQRVSPKAMAFLRLRGLFTTDAEACHTMGTDHREDSDPGRRSRTCSCGKRTPGWVDFRIQTLQKWKQNSDFMLLYRAVQTAPMMVAAVQLESLTLASVDTYRSLLTTEGVSDSVRRNAAKDVLEANGLKQTEGVNIRTNAAVSADSFQLHMAKQRMQRGFPLAQGQIALLREAGVDVPLAVGTQTVFDPDGREIERTLDGDDVETASFGGGRENQDWLPD